MTHRHRYSLSFVTVTLLYLALIGAYLYFQQQPQRIADQRPQEETISLALATFVPPPAPPKPITPPPPPKPVTPPPPVIEQPPAIVPILPAPTTPKAIQKPTPPKVEKPLPKKPLPKKPIKKPRPKKPIPKKRTPKKVSKPKPHTTTHHTRNHGAKRKGTRREIKAKKNRFFAQLRQKINRHKRYPRIAKKRRLEGRVKVTFTIARSGKLTHIKLSGSKLFYRSARQALQSISPINTTNLPVTLPQQLSFTLRYTIH